MAPYVYAQVPMSGREFTMSLPHVSSEAHTAEDENAANRFEELCGGQINEGNSVHVQLNAKSRNVSFHIFLSQGWKMQNVQWRSPRTQKLWNSTNSMGVSILRPPYSPGTGILRPAD